MFQLISQLVGAVGAAALAAVGVQTVTFVLTMVASVPSLFGGVFAQIDVAPVTTTLTSIQTAVTAIFAAIAAPVLVISAGLGIAKIRFGIGGVIGQVANYWGAMFAVGILMASAAAFAALIPTA